MKAIVNRVGQLIYGEGGRRILAGEPVHCGQTLELRLPTGTWQRGRYETRDGRAMFYADGADEPVRLRIDALLRWP